MQSDYRQTALQTEGNEECVYDKIQELFNEMEKNRAQKQKDLLTVIKTTRTSFKNNN